MIANICRLLYRMCYQARCRAEARLMRHMRACETCTYYDADWDCVLMGWCHRYPDALQIRCSYDVCRRYVRGGAP